MGPTVIERIRALKQADAKLDGIDFKKIRMRKLMPGMYLNKKCMSVHSVIYDGIETKVQVVLSKIKFMCTIFFQFIVRKDIVKRGRVTTEMTMMDFALSVIESFDFDITRHAIVDSKYLSSPGGLDLLETYFNNELALNLEGLKDMAKGFETDSLISRTLSRAEKYVDRK